jgi:diguanylate cyclase (GGDEF)-like protein
MNTGAPVGFVTLFSEDKISVETVATVLDYSSFCLQITNNQAALAQICTRIPPDLLIIDSPADISDKTALARLIGNISPLPSVLLMFPADREADTIQWLKLFRGTEALRKPISVFELGERINTLLSARKPSGHPRPVPAGDHRSRVLVVEDSRLQMKVLLDYLKDQDVELITAADGLDALNTIQEVIPDLVLLDVVLPGMDGFEVCRRIKSLPDTAEIPVIIITSLSKHEDKLEALRCGADDFLTKPIDRRELMLKTGSLLKRRQQLAELTSEASRDPLTGLFNRRYLNFALEREILIAAGGDSPLSLIILDVDYFKSYNDRNGHPAGDEVLKTIGSILTSALRKCDIVARYGGEEFLVILPNTDIEGTFRVAEKIRRAVEEYPFPNGDSQPGGKLTVSLGAACFPEHSHNAAELVNLADKAMYRAKQEGRNGFRMHGT